MPKQETFGMTLVHLYEGCKIGYICEQHAAKLHWLWAAVSLKGVCLWPLLPHIYISLRQFMWSIMTNYHF